MSLSYKHASQILTSKNGHALWIGDIQAAENVAWLKENNIRIGNTVFSIVITAAQGFNLKYDGSIKHIHYGLVDSKTQDISKYLDIAAYQIQKGTFHFTLGLTVSSVIVHCGAGVSRVAYIPYSHLLL